MRKRSYPAVITDVLMPQMGLEVSEATVLEVLVSRGAQVAEAAPLIELETDKATTEVTAPRAGHVIAIEVAPGDVVPVGAVLARIADEAEESQTEPAPVATDQGASTRDGDAPRAAAVSAVSAARPPGGGRLRAAPVARRAAQALGVALESVTGTGPRGRITLADVERAAGSASPAPPPAIEAARPLSRLRRTIARRMTASQLIPQYQLQRDVDASHLLAEKDARAAATAPGPRVGVNDLLMQAIAEMVVRHPDLAAVYEDTPEPHLRRYEHVGVGLAVATERGLVVPVVERVDSIGLGQIARRRGQLVAAARDGTLAPDDMAGAAITLSNLAGFGVDRFTAMLNPGESAIVAVGRTTEKVVPRGRAIVIVPTLTVTISFDHRSIDGAVGGAALAELAGLLEGGMAWRP